jgi:hypothetical protein
MTLLTLAEAARRIRCSRSHISRILAGRLDMPVLVSVHIGRRRFIREVALDEWLLEMEDRELEAQRVKGYAIAALDRCRERESHGQPCV